LKALLEVLDILNKYMDKKRTKRGQMHGHIQYNNIILTYDPQMGKNKIYPPLINALVLTGAFIYFKRKEMRL
jgi:hypothetical protein